MSAGTKVFSGPKLDIYDLSLSQWSTLPLPLSSIAGIGIIGDKAILLEAGDFISRLVVYDLTNNTWRLGEILSARVTQIINSGDKLFATNGIQLW